MDAPTAPPAPADARAAILAWAGDHGGVRVGPLQLIGELGARLDAAGLGVARISVSLSDFHPEVVGRQYNWQRGQGPDQIDRRYTPRRSDAYLTSPVKVIHDGAEALRRRLAGPTARLDMPLMAELAEAGLTDFVAFPLKFTDGTRQYVSFSTDRPDGFAGADLAFLEALLPQLCLRIEIEHARLVADQMLRVYLGSYAAPRVIAGDIRRVRGASIDAVILAADMRGFTRLTDALDADAVFAALSAYYDALAGPVMAAGGDVVKLIADGVLAVFPIDGDPNGTAATALAATREAQAALSALSPDELPPGAYPLKAGFALHEGVVTFGNVGSRERLDFTLIGPAVNEAFRIEAMTKMLGRPILLSAPFARLAGESLVESLGFHALKGVREAQELFAPKAG